MYTKISKKYGLLIIALICIVAFYVMSSGGNEMEKNNSGFYQISQDTAKEMMDNQDVIILDVREQYEYDAGHIENSVLLPLSEIATRAEEVLPNKEAIILVYCRSGNRSKQGSMILAELGYTNIYEFGGITTWEYGIVQ